MEKIFSIENFVNHQKSIISANKLSRFIEVTTKIGCSNACQYCQQKQLIETYFRDDKNRKAKLDLSDFAEMLRNIPEDIDICFTGFGEPYDNNDFWQILDYTCTQKRKVHLYTTFKNATEIEIEMLRKLPINSFCIHIPDNENMMNMSVNDSYIKKLNNFEKMRLLNVSYVCIGEPHPNIPESIKKKVKKDKIVQLHAANVDKSRIKSEKLKFHKNCGRIISDKEKVYCNINSKYKDDVDKRANVEKMVLLPDGSLVLCCMDFSLEHVLGNLLNVSYNEILQSKEYISIKESMNCNNNKSILCRRCESACIAK